MLRFSLFCAGKFLALGAVDITHSWDGTSNPDIKAWSCCCLVLARKHQIPSNSVDIGENQGNLASCGAGHLMTGSGKGISVSKRLSHVLCFRRVQHGIVWVKRLK